MPDSDDLTLLEQYAKDGSEAAFVMLVTRYVNLVYSVALQRTGNSHHAEEVSQAVFIILARKAAHLSGRVILSGWLYHTTQLTAQNFIRSEIRRARREQEAHMQSVLDESGTETWSRIAPILHEAMARLNAHDRDAILLRYFENKSVSEMALVMRIAEPAAHKRLTRAVERLRNIFARRGVKLSAAALVNIVAANSVSAAPAGLTTSITAATAQGAAVSGSTLILVKGASKLMAWTKAKMAIVAGAGVLLATALTPVAVHYYRFHVGPEAWRKRFEAAYRLNASEMIKHVKPPYMAERDEYYHTEPSLNSQAAAVKKAPDYFIFRDDGEVFQEWGYSFGSGHVTLQRLLQHAFQLKTYELEGPDRLLNLNVDGDWVIRGELMDKMDTDAILKPLNALLSKELKRTVRIEKQTVKRDVVVASGSITTPISEATPIDIYIADLKDAGGGGNGSGSLADLLNEAGNRLNIPVIAETPDQDFRASWKIHRDTYIQPTGLRHSELIDKLLANLQRQTGLTFRHETRPVEVWVVSGN